MSEDKPSLKRTLSKKFAKQKEKDEPVEEKPSLKRTLSRKFQKQKEEENEPAKSEEKPSLKRTLSKKFGKKQEDGSDVTDEGKSKPKLTRSLSQRFRKDDEKSKLKLRFDIRVVRISKCQINNTTVFLGWKRTAAIAGDTRRAVVTDCCAKFGDVISLDAVLSKPPGEDSFRPSLIFFELKEDKLVRKGTGKAKWHVLGRGSFDLALYHEADEALCIIPLTKKKANIQLELQVTAVWQQLDNQRFEIVQSPAAPLDDKRDNKDNDAPKKKRVELIGNAKYAISSDVEADCYTEEDIDLNLSEIESEDEYKPKFQSMGSLLTGLSGTPAPIPTLKSSDEDDDDDDPFVADDVDAASSNGTNPLVSSNPSTAPAMEDSNPFASPVPQPLPAAKEADKKREETNPFASPPGGESESTPVSGKKSLFKRKSKKVEAIVISEEDVAAPQAVKKEQVVVVGAQKGDCENCATQKQEIEYLRKTLAAQQKEIAQFKNTEKRLNQKLIATESVGKVAASASQSAPLKREVEFYECLERNVFLSNYDFNADHEPISALKLFDDFINLGIFEDASGDFLDRFFASISMFCSQPRIGDPVIEYWISSSVFLLKIQRNAKKRLSVDGDHPLVAFENRLIELITNLVSRIFTNTLKRIEQLLVQSLRNRYQAEHYFRPDELAMGDIIAHFKHLLLEFRENFWSTTLIQIFFTFCVDLIDRFLMEKILGSSEFCSLKSGVKIKMEMSFLSNWLLENEETRDLVDRLGRVTDCANLLIMSKGSGAQSVTQSCANLNSRMIHKILSQYRPEGAAAAESAKRDSFAVIPSGMSKSSQDIVAKLEGQKKFLDVAESDRVDPMLLKRLESKESFETESLSISDSFEENLGVLNQYLRKIE